MSIGVGIFGLFTQYKFGSIGLLVLGSMRLLKPVFFMGSSERQNSQKVRNDYGALYHKAGMVSPSNLTRDGLKQFYDFTLAFFGIGPIVLEVLIFFAP